MKICARVLHQSVCAVCAWIGFDSNNNCIEINLKQNRKQERTKMCTEKVKRMKAAYMHKYIHSNGP